MMAERGHDSRRLLVLEGDGIGPEVVAQALRVLEAAEERFGLAFRITRAPVGGAALELEGVPVSERTLELAREADAVLLGAVGGPRWDDLPTHRRPERGLLALRSALDLYANLRPATVLPPLAGASTLRPDLVRGIDLLVVRELVSGIYFGEPRGRETEGGRRSAFNTMRYDEEEVRRVAHTAFRLAGRRRGKVTSVDKANVLEVSALWREVVTEVAAQYPEVVLEHQYVDNCSMQLVRDPSQFDVILTGNLFGDILSDEAAMITGSIGMLPSASVGGESALYEPVHGSAPDIAGTDRANPLATILSLAMLLEITCGRQDAAEAVRTAVAAVLEEGARTGDISQEGCETVSCSAMGTLVCERLRG